MRSLITYAIQQDELINILYWAQVKIDHQLNAQQLPYQYLLTLPDGALIEEREEQDQGKTFFSLALPSLAHAYPFPFLRLGLPIIDSVYSFLDIDTQKSSEDSLSWWVKGQQGASLSWEKRLIECYCCHFLTPFEAIHPWTMTTLYHHPLCIWKKPFLLKIRSIHL